MLVLTRKCQEAIVVGTPADFERVAKITVLEIRSGKVKLGIQVDADVPVLRSEVWERIRTNGTAVAAM